MDCLFLSQMNRLPNKEQLILGLPWWLRWPRICLQCRGPGFDPWVGKIPWRRKWQSIPALLPGKSHGWRSLIGYSPWVAKSWTRLSDFNQSLTQVGHSFSFKEQVSFNFMAAESWLLLLLSHFSRVRLCATPQKAPLSLGFSRQEHWSGLPFRSPMHESEK